MHYADSKCKILETHHPHVYTVVGPDVLTGNIAQVPIPAAELHAYRRGGVYIQDAMPSLNDEQREFLISGVSTDEGWNEIVQGE